MTSAVDPAPALPVLWITGLAGCGKSALAQAVVQRLHARGLRPLLLDGDVLTRALEPPPVSYEPERRLERAWRNARLASMAAWQGVPVVVATVSLVHAVQRWNREHAPALVEVLIEAQPAQLRVHRPHLYAQGGEQHVVGRDIPAEFPTHPELVIRQDYLPASLERHAGRCIELWDAAAVRPRQQP